MRLDVHLLVPGAAPGEILLTPDGSLPRISADGDADEASVVAIDRGLRDELGLIVPILESHPRWSGVADGDPIPTLATTEPAPAGWLPPIGLAFGRADGPLDAVPEAIRPRAHAWLAEIRGEAEPPPLRPRWSRPGWSGRAGAWMAREAALAGRPLVGEPRPFYLRGISALLRAPAAGGDLYLKAVFPPFHAEPRITTWLADRAGPVLPRVLAIEEDEGWLLMADVAAPLIGELPDADRPAALAAGARSVVALQRRIATELGGLAAAGADRRPLAAMPEQLDAALGPDGLSLPDVAVAPDRRQRAVAATAAALERVAGIGFPDTVVHGDFHPGNAAIAASGVVIIDWSDAAIGNPLVDLATWIAWSEDRPDEIEAAVGAWVEAWADVLDPALLRHRIDDILLVGAAYQVISYDGIVRALEPATRYTMGSGGGSWLRRLERLAGRSR